MQCNEFVVITTQTETEKLLDSITWVSEQTVGLAEVLCRDDDLIRVRRRTPLGYAEKALPISASNSLAPMGKAHEPQAIEWSVTVSRIASTAMPRGLLT